MALLATEGSVAATLIALAAALLIYHAGKLAERKQWLRSAEKDKDVLLGDHRYAVLRIIRDELPDGVTDESEFPERDGRP